MPYQVYEENGRHCVHKKNPDGSKGEMVSGGCHNTAADASAHMKALYANVEDASKESLPLWGATTFEELEQEYEREEKEMEMDELLGHFNLLLKNIMDSPLEDKTSAVESLTADFAKRMTEKAKWTRAYINDLPDSAFLYIESGGEKDDQGKTAPRTLRHLPYKDKEGNVDLEHARNAISRASQIKLKDGSRISPEKAASLQSKARKAAGIKDDEKGLVKEIVDGIGEWLYRTFMKEEGDSKQPLFIWKEAETDRYMWLARYSNNFLDNDTPPDIISAQSHRRFVDLVDKGLEPKPELWLWHVPQWRMGEATAVAYDESGFALAMGTFDPQAEPVAQWLKDNQSDMAVSHGMPPNSIKRDPEDPSVIIEHVTREISPLPRWAAANKLTGFVIFDEQESKEADEMSIPEKKKLELIEGGINEDVLQKLEQMNKSDAEVATAAGIKSKEAGDGDVAVETEDAPAEEAPDSEEETPTETPSEEEAASPADQPPTRAEVAEAVANVINPLLEQLTTNLDELNKEIALLKQSDEEKVAKAVTSTPSASIAALVAQRINKESARVAVEDGDPLKESKPTETESEEPSAAGIGIPFVDKMLKDHPDSKSRILTNKK